MDRCTAIMPFRLCRKKENQSPQFSFLFTCANCTETVQSELSHCQAYHSDSNAVLFHTVFNRTVENFYNALTFLSPSKTIGFRIAFPENFIFFPKRALTEPYQQNRCWHSGATSIVVQALVLSWIFRIEMLPAK